MSSFDFIFPKADSKPLYPLEVKEGDVLFCTFPSTKVEHPMKIARKYLVLKLDNTPWAGPKATCVVLYAYRYPNVGEIVELNLPTLPADQWGMEV